MYSAYVRRYSKMILAFQRSIICAHEQVPRDMDVFCACTQIYDFQLCIICKSLLRFGESVSAQNPTMVRRLLLRIYKGNYTNRYLEFLRIY